MARAIAPLVILVAVAAGVAATVQNVTVPAPHRFSPVLSEPTTRAPVDLSSASPQDSLAGLVEDALRPDVEPATRSGLALLQSLYEPHTWPLAGPAVQAPLQPACRRDLALYSRALHNGTAWAVKSKCCPLF